MRYYIGSTGATRSDPFNEHCLYLEGSGHVPAASVVHAYAIEELPERWVLQFDAIEDIDVDDEHNALVFDTEDQALTALDRIGKFVTHLLEARPR